MNMKYTKLFSLLAFITISLPALNSPANAQCDFADQDLANFGSATPEQTASLLISPSNTNFVQHAFRDDQNNPVPLIGRITGKKGNLAIFANATGSDNQGNSRRLSSGRAFVNVNAGFAHSRRNGRTVTQLPIILAPTVRSIESDAQIGNEILAGAQSDSRTNRKKRRARIKIEALGDQSNGLDALPARSILVHRIDSEFKYNCTAAGRSLQTTVQEGTSKVRFKKSDKGGKLTLDDPIEIFLANKGPVEITLDLRLERGGLYAIDFVSSNERSASTPDDLTTLAPNQYRVSFGKKSARNDAGSGNTNDAITLPANTPLNLGDASGGTGIQI